MEKMKLLVRVVLAFMWIYQLANCRVLSQPNVQNEVIYGHLSGNFSDASITHEKANLTANQFDSGAVMTSVPFNRRSIGSARTILLTLKKHLKKLFLAYAFYAPEIGFCSCMAKFAWYTYPIVPEMTYRIMGRARRMIGGFMHDFAQGFIDSYQLHDYERIGNKVSQTSADDYLEYSNGIDSEFGPFRRVGQHADNLSENVPVITKVNDKVLNVVEMLKNLQPKNPTNDQFLIRYARAYSGEHRNTVSEKDIVQGRSPVASNVQYVANRRILGHGPPAGLPGFEDLPPADYNYYKDGVYHHVHDLRKDKSRPIRSGGWLSVDFQNNILAALGFAPPGKSIEPSLMACGKSYVFGVIVRTLQGFLLK